MITNVADLLCLTSKAYRSKDLESPGSKTSARYVVAIATFPLKLYTKSVTKLRCYMPLFSSEKTSKLIPICMVFGDQNVVAGNLRVLNCRLTDVP